MLRDLKCHQGITVSVETYNKWHSELAETYTRSVDQLGAHFPAPWVGITMLNSHLHIASLTCAVRDTVVERVKWKLLKCLLLLAKSVKQK